SSTSSAEVNVAATMGAKSASSALDRPRLKYRASASSRGPSGTGTAITPPGGLGWNEIYVARRNRVNGSRHIDEFGGRKRLSFACTCLHQLTCCMDFRYGRALSLAKSGSRR